MGSPAAAPTPLTEYCAQCSTKFNPGAKFCPKCGASLFPQASASADASVLAPSRAVPSSQDEISVLEQSVANNPNDESYRKLLAVALHDDAMKDWVRDPTDKGWLCVSREGLKHARKQFKRASELKFADPELRKQIDDGVRLVDSMEERKFAGSWLMVVVLGLFYIIPGVLWWYVNRRPGYLINKDYMEHVRTGKQSGAAARMGGLQGKVYDFFENVGGEWGWLFGLVFMLSIGVLLSPIFMIIAYKQNYLDPQKESA
jgi:hypothetical protein